MEANQTNNKYRGDTPKIECFTKRSKDGQFLIEKTVITHIMRVDKVEAVLRGEVIEEVDA